MMIRTNSAGASGRRGLAMAATVVTVFATAAMVGVMLTLADSTKRVATVERYDSEARYLAEGAVEIARREVLKEIAKWEPPSSSYEVEIGDAAIEVEVVPSGYFKSLTDPSGIQTWWIGYVLQSTVEAGGSQVTTHKLVNAEATPLFQYAVFYSNELEIHPGPDMTIGGRVHSNRDIFMNTASSTLRVDSNYLRAVGDIFRYNKGNPYSSNGTVEVRKWVANPFDASEPAEYVEMPSLLDMWSEGVFPDDLTKLTAYDSDFDEGWDGNGDGDYTDIGDYPPFVLGALDMWGSPDGYGDEGYTLLTGEHGIEESVTPQIGSIEKFELLGEGETGNWTFDEDLGKYVEVAAGSGDYGKGFYHKEAGLQILVDYDGDLQITGSGGVDLTAALSGIVTLTEIYDARQADGSEDKVEVVSVDVEALKLNGYYPANGLMYAAHMDSGTGTKTGGIHLFNGQELGGPITVVTEGAVYVEGDFNTVNKTGASVIGDAVNLLSNSWDNTKSAGSLPFASDTTYNLAIVTGNTVTGDSGYSGGLENLPRFHEDWSGKDATINGSFVNLWESKRATGAWKYGADRYTAPIRDWSYDTDFNNLANLPPFTPMGVTTAEVAMW